MDSRHTPQVKKIKVAAAPLRCAQHTHAHHTYTHTHTQMASTLSRLASDLSFTVTLQIADEVRAAAREEDVDAGALLAMLVALSVVLSSVPNLLSALLFLPEIQYQHVPLMEFGKRLLDICRRITMTLTVNLLASSVAAREELRMVRISTLLSVAVFFLFLERSADSARPK